MKEYDMINNRLNYREEGTKEWIPYTVEEISKIVVDKVVMQKIINENYLKSVKTMITPLLEMMKPEDKRYEVAKTILQGLTDSYVGNDFTYPDFQREDIIREAVTASFR